MKPQLNIKKTSYPWYLSYLNLGDALEEFQEMIEIPETETSYVWDATIYRFNRFYDQLIKTLKKICNYEDYDVT